jgi:flagellar assembly factor FliW
MTQIASEYFGTLNYGPESVFHFPEGLPGFEDETLFIALQIAEQRPLAYLQSARRPGLCFLTLPVETLSPGYQLNIVPEDLQLLGFAETDQPRIGADILCLALISVDESQPATANLRAPLVINLSTHLAVQAIQDESTHPVRFPIALAAAKESEPCY